MKKYTRRFTFIAYLLMGLLLKPKAIEKGRLFPSQKVATRGVVNKSSASNWVSIKSRDLQEF